MLLSTFIFKCEDYIRDNKLTPYLRQNIYDILLICCLNYYMMFIANSYILWILEIKNETLEFKKSIDELNEAMQSVCAMLNKHSFGFSIIERL